MRKLFVLLAALVITALPSLALARQPQSPPAQTRQENKPVKTTPAPASVNLNTATPAELEALPGVGAATAARIVEYRQKNGAFKKVEDLMNVRGIGEKTFLNLKPMIVVTPPKGLGW